MSARLRSWACRSFRAPGAAAHTASCRTGCLRRLFSRQTRCMHSTLRCAHWMPIRQRRSIWILHVCGRSSRAVSCPCTSSACTVSRRSCTLMRCSIRTRAPASRTSCSLPWRSSPARLHIERERCAPIRCSSSKSVRPTGSGTGRRTILRRGGCRSSAAIGLSRCARLRRRAGRCRTLYVLPRTSVVLRMRSLLPCGSRSADVIYFIKNTTRPCTLQSRTGSAVFAGFTTQARRRSLRTILSAVGMRCWRFGRMCCGT